jgi:anti-anti-sigma factor
MDVSFVPARESLIARPVGRVDESTWEEFGAVLARGIEQAAAQDREILIIDLSAIDYMSSRGLRVLTTTKARGIASGISIKLAAPNDVMREILAISRYDRLFDVDDSLPDTHRTAS